MLNIPLASVDDVDRAVLAIGTDYPLGTLLKPHAHRRAQFLYGMSGLMEVETEDGAWVIPPYSGVWIPAGKQHRVLMRGVSTRSLYIDPQVPVRDTLLCQALTVSPLLHHLLLASVEVPALHDESGRDGDLIRLLLHELRQAPSLPLFAPLPAHPRLLELCRDFLRAPAIDVTADLWASELHCSSRTFSRLFRQQTGLSFGAWRQQACLLAAVTRLAAGNPVTRVALELGYDSPSAFSSMFRRSLGVAPSSYQASAENAAAAT
ncbi:helix-turn-helix transcriptional regulator [Pseudomonas nitroreducens]|uniref:Helix-turn-helix transcriptional regulator n=1 Tax=Pseudomonas nitroreducens TaxID=46680 RepID=A0A5R9A4A7_PSENT|nr:helix-turn-helix transcriptional regulator [Pseudomonas nitroreducens]TLP73513.1 helix-turn-helix transcriptional regulator [Pseudomonas nitroreducens]